jgi:hypothetical protein
VHPWVKTDLENFLVREQVLKNNVEWKTCVWKKAKNVFDSALRVAFPSKHGGK